MIFRAPIARSLAVLAVLVAVASTARGDIVVYDDAVAAGWQDWSWGGVTRDFARTSPVHGGTRSIGITYTGSWSGLQLGRNDAVDITGLDRLRCWVHGGSSGGQAVQIEVGNHLTGAKVDLSITPTANTWTRVDVPLDALGTNQVTYLYWFNNTAGAQATFSVDDVAFVASGLPSPTPTATPGPVAGPALQVDPSSGRHAISELIYGMNFADQALATALRLPVVRWGGNSTTRYNWRTDTSNHASDWYFENIPNDNPNPAALPDGSSSDRFVEANLAAGAESLVTVPLIGWTPRGRAIGCGFGVAKYGAQQSTDPWQPDCGNGVRPDGTDITGNNPADVSDPIAPSFVQDWMAHLIGRYGTAAAGGVRFYNLDNEPMLWNSTHRDVHPDPPGYDELRDRTFAYAAAVKAADPTAETLGPAEWGWSGYFWSALDAAPGGAWWNNPLDRLAHGNLPLVAWYLQQLNGYQQQHGVRLLDYLDLHYYPQASGVSLSGAGSTSTQALRLRSTRSLWDPTYVDESWIADTVRLIPRMRDWVTQYYPGTKLAIGEYNWGALDHINGALAQADVLGIFGREGLGLATLWDPPTAAQPGAFAFRMYRNYDGAGGGFGDVGVSATSSDQATVAVYAAQRSADGALTVIAINKTAQPQISSVTVAGLAAAATAHVYRYAPTNLAAIESLADLTIPADGASVTWAPQSITLLVLPAASAASPTPTPTATPAPPTATRTATGTSTRTATATVTRTPPATSTATATSSLTRTVTATPTSPPVFQLAGSIHAVGGAPLAGVAVGLPPSGQSATSDATGAYAFAAAPGVSLQIAPRRVGAGGTAVSALDAAWVLQAVAGTRTLTSLQRVAADVTGDGTLSTLDAVYILQRAVGGTNPFPAAQACASDWLFVPTAAAAPFQTLVQPALAGGSCQPGAIAFAPLSANATARDFTAVLLGDCTGNWGP